MKSVLLLVAILIGANTSFCFDLPLLSEEISVINVFSGAPQPADGTSEKSGGFGDVAANVVAAHEIKKLYPKVKVRLLVTSASARPDPNVPTTNEIIKIMLPQLDPSKKDTVQSINGVEVIFLKTDFLKVLKASGQLSITLLIRTLVKSLRHEVPLADLNLNFSNYPGSAAIVRINSQIGIGVEENYGGSRIVKNVFRSGPNSNDGIFVHVNSGPESTGFMLNHFVQSSNENIATIRHWANKNKFGITAQGFKILFAYTAEWRSTQIYLDAVSNLVSNDSGQVDEPIYLFVRDFPELDKSSLPTNVHVVAIRGMPHAVMSALIHEAYLSPLVTGDISWGQALSSTTPNKTFIYEAPWWKKGAAARVRLALSKDLFFSRHSLASMFFTTQSLALMSREDMKNEGKKLFHFITSFSLQTKIHGAIKSRLEGWDVLNNTLQMASLYFDRKHRANSSETMLLGGSIGSKGVSEILEKLEDGSAEQIDLSLTNISRAQLSGVYSYCKEKLSQLNAKITN